MLPAFGTVDPRVTLDTALLASPFADGGTAIASDVTACTDWDTAGSLIQEKLTVLGGSLVLVVGESDE